MPEGRRDRADPRCCTDRHRAALAAPRAASLGTAASLGAWLLAGLAPTGCTVAPRPLAPAAVTEGLAAREVAVATAAQAIELSGLAPAFARPPSTTAGDPDAAGIWHACAWAYARGPVTARRRLQVARAVAGSAGLPGPVGLGAETLAVDDLERQNQVRLTFDLLGVLGLGRSAAAANLATAEQRRALGELEQAVWAARFAVDAARVRVAAARLRVDRLQDLAAQVAVDLQRLDLLDQRGWLAPARVGAARAMAAHLQRRLEAARTGLASRREALAAAAGLPPGAAALAGVTAGTLDGFDPLAVAAALPDGTALLARQPELRAARLDYAVAEARLRHAAAQAWPELRLGPRLHVTPATALVGGVLDLSLPWPGVVSGLVDAAQQERELRRELLEDGLLRTLAAAASRRLALEQAQATLRGPAPQIERGTAAAWSAARAGFAVDTGALPLWTDRLERRIEGCLAGLEAREQAILADLAYREVLGPPVDRAEVSR